jgi:hypothetical protein
VRLRGVCHRALVGEHPLNLGIARGLHEARIMPEARRRPPAIVFSD